MTQPDSFAQITAPVAGQKIFATELPDYDFLRHCVRCGRCLPVCPTYQETGLETYSPRGRLSLIKAVEDGKLPFSPEVESHLYHCLDCRMCNTVCPASIPIAQSIVAARAAFGERKARPWWRKLAFEHVLISAQRLGLALTPFKWYQRLGLPRLIKPVLKLLPPPLSILARMEALLPRLPKKSLRQTLAPVTPTKGERKYRVGFFLGCMMSELFAEESAATVRVLTAAGCEVITPRGQSCCGAPQDDQGNREIIRRFARANIALFEKIGPVDAIVTDCAACSGMLKEYAELLHEDAEFAGRARTFSRNVKDIFEWYDQILPAAIGLETPTPAAVTLHDACHLANAQGVRLPQRRLLKRIGSVRLAEMEDPSACCGSAGIYNITHPEMSDKRLARKLCNICNTQAPTVITNGPGCLLQLRAAAQKGQADITVKHISQLLAEVTGDKTV